MENKTPKTAILEHYRQPNLEENIQSAFETAGLTIKDYTDTESLDEFHIRGRTATRELARLAGFTKGLRVLDLGCGVGGPARMLAAEFGCIVTGIDLVDEYCRAAQMITHRAGLSHRVDFRQGDMTALDFDAGSFDAVWTLHTIMNIADKVKLFESVLKVLKPGGRFALYEICAGDNSPPVFPVPWAGDAGMSFLLRSHALRRCLIEGGFTQLEWRDVSAEAITWFQDIAKLRTISEKTPDAARAGKPIAPEKKSRPGISLLLGKTAALKSRNVFRNLSEDRIRTVFGVFRKPDK